MFFKIKNRKSWKNYLINHGLVKLSTPQLSKKELVQFCYTIGQCSRPKEYFNDIDFPEIYRIEKNKIGKKPTGMFSDGELDWHANGSSRKSISQQCVAIYCVKSDVNIPTIWCNLAKAFSQLEENQKQFLRGIKIRVGPRFNNFYKSNKKPERDALLKLNSGWKPLIVKHPYFDIECCLFHHLFFIAIKDKNGKNLQLDSFVKNFYPYFFQDKYLSTHVFKAGDLILSDQLMTVHKRGSYTGKRLLYRLTFNYEYF